MSEYTGIRTHEELEVLRGIESQRCPWCGEGPFKVLAGHTNQAHGIGGRELRTLAGLGAKASVCDVTVSDNFRELLIHRPDWEETTRKALAASVSVGAYAMAQKAKNERFVRRSRERDDDIIRAVVDGELRSSVAAHYGINVVTVNEVLRRHGVFEDGRKNAATVRPFDAAKLTAAMQAGHKEKRDRKIARFHELGGTWDAIQAMAKEDGRTYSQMRETLKYFGLPVPDGRRVSLLQGRTRKSTPKGPKPPCSDERCERPSVARGMCMRHYDQRRSDERKSLKANQ